MAGGMNDFEGTSARLARQIEIVLERNPQSRTLLKAFEPMLRETQRLADEMICTPVDVSSLDRARFRAGIPLIRQTGLLLPDDPWERIAGAMIPAAIRGFPALRAELDHRVGAR